MTAESAVSRKGKERGRDPRAHIGGWSMDAARSKELEAGSVGNGKLGRQLGGDGTQSA